MNQMQGFFSLFSSLKFWRRFFVLWVPPYTIPLFSSAKVAMLLDTERTYLLSWHAEQTLCVSVSVGGKHLAWFPYRGHLKLQFEQEGPVPVVLKARGLFQIQSSRFLILVSTEQPENIELGEVLLASKTYPEKVRAPKTKALDPPVLLKPVISVGISPYPVSYQAPLSRLETPAAVFSESRLPVQIDAFTSQNIEIPPFSIDYPTLDIDLHLQPTSYV
jgi:hypothetical protein